MRKYSVSIGPHFFWAEDEQHAIEQFVNMVFTAAGAQLLPSAGALDEVDGWFIVKGDVPCPKCGESYDDPYVGCDGCREKFMFLDEEDVS